ncbi:hypothetical protein CK489_28740 [Bradyrhizobium sp. UFLA03-84]|nr:hypothetical protein CK489_28740 [Bradyrhizobium sp. UFLA03-84]
MRTLRLSDEFIEKVDRWAAEQYDAPGRSEAIRRLVELGLTVKPKNRPESERPNDLKETPRQRAREMAGFAIDKMSDTTASPDDRASRKRRLIKGPEEFQKVRRDRSRK